MPMPMGKVFDISSASSLPTWTPPESEDRAVVEIIVFCTSLGENVYRVGKHLLWVKDRVKHGEFGKWVEDYLPISPAQHSVL